MMHHHFSEWQVIAPLVVFFIVYLIGATEE